MGRYRAGQLQETCRGKASGEGTGAARSGSAGTKQAPPAFVACGDGAAPAVRLLPGPVEEEQKSLPRISANQQSIYQIIIAPNEDKSNELGVL